MISYPYIESLFRNVLRKSKTIEGRFFVCPRAGAEINSDALGQVLTDSVMQQQGSKYPCALLMPPRSIGEFTDKVVDWERYRITMFFLRTSYHDNGFGANINPNTQTSLRTIQADWDAMKVCAIDFLRMLEMVQAKNMLQKDTLRLVRGPKTFVPVSSIGADNASGIRVDFELEILPGCVITDYEDEALGSIALPGTESEEPAEDDGDVDRSSLTFTFVLEVEKAIAIDLRRYIGDQTATMDWGDGTVDESEADSEVLFFHNYQPGTYEAKLTLVTGLTDPEARATNSVRELYLMTAPNGITTTIGPSLSKCYQMKFFQAINFGMLDIPAMPVWPQGSDEPYEQIRTVNLAGNQLSAAACSRVFVSCNKAGWPVGYLDLTGSPGLDSLTTAGANAKAALIAKHWTVNI